MIPNAAAAVLRGSALYPTCGVDASAGALREKLVLNVFRVVAAVLMSHVNKPTRGVNT